MPGQSLAEALHLLVAFAACLVQRLQVPHHTKTSNLGLRKAR
jgi:hypothetical protein